MTEAQYKNLKRKLESGELEERDIARAQQMVDDYEAAQARKPNSGVDTIFEEGSFMDNFGKSGVGFLNDMIDLVPNALTAADQFSTDANRFARANLDALYSGQSFPGNSIADGGAPYIWDGAAGATGDYLGARYGGWPEIKETAYNDPFGVAADVGTVGMGPLAAGRGLARASGTGTGVLARTGRQAGDTLEQAGTLMEAIDPYAFTLNSILRPIHSAVNPIAKSSDEFTQPLYAYPADIGGDLQKTNEFGAELADRGYLPTTAGVKKIKFDKEVAANELNAAIQVAEQSGKDISIYNLTTSLRLRRQEIIDANGPPDATASTVKQIDAAIDHLESLDTDALTISSARQMRQEWEKNIPFQTEPSVDDVPVAAGRREVSNALRDEINDISPELAGANNRYSEAETARRSVEQAKLADARSDMGPLFAGFQRLGAELGPAAFTGKGQKGRAPYNTRNYFDAIFNETASPIGRGRRAGQQYFGGEENYIPDGSQVTDPREEEEEEKTIMESAFDVFFRRYWN
jgi:hypothetical protein